ncbi:MAG: DinB family protein [Candidatus Thorarchaeota archaeon]
MSLRYKSDMNLLERIGQYMIWADNAIWRIVQELTDEEYSHAFGEFGGSLQQRYIHLAEDTWEWYYDWTGEDSGEEPGFQNMSRDTLFEFILSHNQKWFDMIERTGIDTLELKRNGKSVTLEFDEMLFHLNNHATYHRGQIVMGLRLLGKDVHMTDYVPHRFATL